MKRPRGPEQAALWLREDGGEQKTGLVPGSPRQVRQPELLGSSARTKSSRCLDGREGGTAPGRLCQQAPLQLLVLKQEQEREQLLGLLRGLSPDDLQDPERDLPAGEGTMTSSPSSAACPDHLVVATTHPPTCGVFCDSSG